MWRDIRVLQAAGQLVSVILVVSVLVFFVMNLMSAADDRGLLIRKRTDSYRVRVQLFAY